MEPEIITRIERSPGGAEPMLTISQLQGLLRDATALAQAQRPIVIHTSEQPATTPQTAPAGAVGYIPAPPVQAYATAAVLSPEKRNPWPVVFMAAGAVGFSSGTAAIATGNEGAVAVACASIAAWSVATYRLVFCREV